MFLRNLGIYLNVYTSQKTSILLVITLRISTVTFAAAHHVEKIQNLTFRNNDAA
jgi:hypothetical protein